MNGARRAPVAPRGLGPAYWLAQQRRFMAERGTTLAGYIAYYTALAAAARGTPLAAAEVDLDQLRAIHAADVATLRSYEAAAARGRW